MGWILYQSVSATNTRKVVLREVTKSKVPTWVSFQSYTFTYVNFIFVLVKKRLFVDEQKMTVCQKIVGCPRATKTWFVNAYQTLKWLRKQEASYPTLMLAIIALFLNADQNLVSERLLKAQVN